MLIALDAHYASRLMKLKFMNVMKFSLGGEKKSHCVFTEKKSLCHEDRISHLCLAI